MAKHQGARMWKVVKTKVRHNLSHTFVLSHSALRPRGGQGKVSGLEPPTQVVHMLPGGVGSMTKQKCLTTKSSGGQSLHFGFVTLHMYHLGRWIESHSPPLATTRAEWGVWQNRILQMWKIAHKELWCEHYQIISILESLVSYHARKRKIKHEENCSIILLLN